MEHTGSSTLRTTSATTTTTNEKQQEQQHDVSKVEKNVDVLRRGNNASEVEGLWSELKGTKVVASIPSASKAKNGSHTVYTIDVHVYFDEQLARHWNVYRRYSDFDRLYRFLKEISFPVPELPPKSLWFHTSSFIQERRMALNLWTSGILYIWQSSVPVTAATAYQVNEVLESFLCDVDTERFTASVEGMSGGHGEQPDFGASPTAASYEGAGSTFASLARAWRVPSKVPASIPPTIQETAALSPKSTLIRKSKSSDQIAMDENIANTIGAKEKQQAQQQQLQTRPQSPRKSGADTATSGKSSRGSLGYRAASMDDLAALGRTPDELIIRNSSVAGSEFGASTTESIMSRSLPNTGLPDSLAAPVTSLPSMNNIVATGDVGVAVDLRSYSGGSPSVKKYSTFDREGRKVVHSFRPFTATVVYHGDATDSTSIAGPPDASTPVSVPPTPHGQGEFFQSWSQYTLSVLDFVAERLDKVSKRTNILDEHDGHLSEDLRSPRGKADAATSPSSKQKSVQRAASNDSRNVDDADEMFFEHALGNNAEQESSQLTNSPMAAAPDSSPMMDTKIPPTRSLQEEARFRSYFNVGERLVTIILRESESAVDPIGSDWEFVANTKNVIVMKRRNPIRRRYLKGQAAPGQITPSGAGTASSAQVPPSPESVSTQPSIHSANIARLDFPNRLLADDSNGVSTENSPNASQVKQPVVDSSSAQQKSSVAAASSRQYCFMGRGVIHASAEDIFNIVRRPQTRHSYDRMLKEEVILENVQSIQNRNGPISFTKLASDSGPGDAIGSVEFLSEGHFTVQNEAEKSSQKVSNPDAPTTDRVLVKQASSSLSATATSTNPAPKTEDDALQIPDADAAIGDLLVYYHLFETNRCFLRYSRDFCVLQYAKAPVPGGKSNKYVVVGASVGHTDCPTREDVVRATLPIFGWVIEPVSKNKSKVSYIIQLDFGGSVPSQLLNTISFRQPLCVYYLGKYITELKATQSEQKKLNNSTDGQKARPLSPETTSSPS